MFPENFRFRRRERIWRGGGAHAPTNSWHAKVESCGCVYPSITIDKTCERIENERSSSSPLNPRDLSEVSLAGKTASALSWFVATIACLSATGYHGERSWFKGAALTLNFTK